VAETLERLSENRDVLRSTPLGIEYNYDCTEQVVFPQSETIHACVHDFIEALRKEFEVKIVHSKVHAVPFSYVWSTDLTHGSIAISDDGKTATRQGSQQWTEAIFAQPVSNGSAYATFDLTQCNTAGIIVGLIKKEAIGTIDFYVFDNNIGKSYWGY
jgi:hypothetical protein